MNLDFISINDFSGLHKKVEKEQTKRTVPKYHWEFDKSRIYDFSPNEDTIDVGDEFRSIRHNVVSESNNVDEQGSSLKSSMVRHVVQIDCFSMFLF